MVSLSSSSYLITSISPLVISNDQIVTVSFASSTPAPGDWIGAYSPADVADVFATVPVKFGNCSVASDYLKLGTGSMAFNLTNLRADVSFYYFSGGLTNSVARNTSSEWVSFENINQPLRNRVVPTGDPNVLSLVWSAANPATPTAKWGTVSGSYPYIVPASVSNVTRTSLCGSPANSTGWHDLGNIYTAAVSGLVDMQLSNSFIFYKFGDLETDQWSDEVQFLVPPAAGQVSTSRGTKVAILADMGVGSTATSLQTLTWRDTGEASYNTTQSMTRLIQQNQIDAVFLPGDLSYADGYLANWDFYMDMVSPVAGARLFFSQVGNHESDYPNSPSNAGYGADSGGECGVVSLAMMPQPSPASPNSPWYSYDIGLIHYLSMSTEHNFTIGSPQYLFLEADLKQVDKTVTPWIIFSGHRPMYVDSSWCCLSFDDDSCDGSCEAGSDIGVMKQLQANVEPLLHTYGVQLAFNGHYHNVQRQGAVYQNHLVQAATTITDADGNPVAIHKNANATVWLVVGTGGQTPVLPSRMYSWSELTLDGLNGFAVVEAVNATYLYYEWINSANNQVYDRMALIQSDPSGSSSDKIGLSVGAIVGIAIASVVVASGAMFLIVRSAYPHSKKAEDSSGLAAFDSASTTHQDLL